LLQVLCQDLFPGMVVARSIMDSSDRVLLARGQVLTEYYIRRIKEINIPVVFVEDGMGLEELQGPVSWETAQRSARVLRKSYEACMRTGQLQIGDISSQVDQIIDELLDNRSTMIGMAGLKSHDEYTYQHSVHVCILSVMIGIGLGYPRQRVRELGVGAMLHDIGKILIPREILNKAECLTAGEWEVVQGHTWEGFNLMRRSDQVTLLSAHVALQHHERLDGSGYPRALLGESIHEYAQITAAADIFDALVSDRPYRDAFSNKEALEILNGYRDTHIKGRLIDQLQTYINPYPLGTIVELSNGDIAVVAECNDNDAERPAVKPIFSASGQVCEKPIINLGESGHINIVRILDPQLGRQVAAQYLRQKIETSTLEEKK
jgi:HD-GYP domain-containing protein (c-di-GMP phosphodiesterase class II)